MSFATSGPSRAERRTSPIVHGTSPIVHVSTGSPDRSVGHMAPNPTATQRGTPDPTVTRHTASDPSVTAAAAVEDPSRSVRPPKTGLRITVLVVSGHSLSRSGLARLLEEDPRFEVVGTSEVRQEVAALCAATTVDVVVYDVDGPSGDALEMVNAITTRSPKSRVLLLAVAADWTVVPAMASGAAGYLLKDTDPEAMRSAVVSVHLGEKVLCREAAQLLIASCSGRRLTPREGDVMRLIARGVDNRSIAKELDIDEKTVRNYVSRLYHKLAIHSRTQVAAYALHVRSDVSEQSSSDYDEWHSHG